jgi:hypothetical protein
MIDLFIFWEVIIQCLTPYFKITEKYLLDFIYRDFAREKKFR